MQDHAMRDRALRLLVETLMKLSTEIHHPLLEGAVFFGQLLLTWEERKEG